MDPAMRAHLELERALRAGDLRAARACFAPDSGFPEVRDDYLGMWVLQHALYLAPVETVRALLSEGAEPNFETGDGFPALLLVLHHRDDPAERRALVSALLDHGADPNVHGFNDWTALHLAAGRGEDDIVDLLLAGGADPTARTRIDDLATPADEAAAAGHAALAARLREAAAQ